MNFYTDLNPGDYVVFEWTGKWDIHTNATKIVSGVLSSPNRVPTWSKTFDPSGIGKTTLTLTNFLKI